MEADGQLGLRDELCRSGDGGVCRSGGGGGGRQPSGRPPSGRPPSGRPPRAPGRRTGTPASREARAVALALFSCGGGAFPARFCCGGGGGGEGSEDEERCEGALRRVPLGVALVLDRLDEREQVGEQLGIARSLGKRLDGHHTHPWRRIGESVAKELEEFSDRYGGPLRRELPRARRLARVAPVDAAEHLGEAALVGDERVTELPDELTLGFLEGLRRWEGAEHRQCRALVHIGLEVPGKAGREESACELMVLGNNRGGPEELAVGGQHDRRLREPICERWPLGSARCAPPSRGGRRSGGWREGHRRVCGVVQHGMLELGQVDAEEVALELPLNLLSLAL